MYVAAEDVSGDWLFAKMQKMGFLSSVGYICYCAADGMNT